MKFKDKRSDRKNLVEKEKIRRHGPDKVLLAIAGGMIIFGAIMIFDASVYQANQPPFNDPFHFLKLHLIWLVVGFVAASPFFFWDYRKYTKLAFPALLVMILLLILVLFSPDVNGSKRWLSIGSEYIVIQPAEFIKPVFIVYLATWLAKERKSYASFNEAFRYGFIQKLIGFGFMLALILALIIMEPDLGTALIIAATSFAIFLAAGTDIAHLVGSGLMLVFMMMMGVFAAILAPYRLARVKTYLSILFKGQVDDPQGAGYQMYQILIGIGSAGLWGKGFGQSRQRFGYLVELTAFTDSIFAVILEELGMVGGAIFVFTWLIFLWTGLKVARHAPDRQGRLIAIGITVWLTLQAMFNMGANVALIPLTGIPLPFITYGGSATMTALIGVAILLNISMYTQDEPKYD